MDINKIACIGAGLIGQGWATEFSSKGFEVILQDIDGAILDAAIKRVRENLRLMEENSIVHALMCDLACACTVFMIRARIEFRQAHV